MKLVDQNWLLYKMNLKTFQVLMEIMAMWSTSVENWKLTERVKVAQIQTSWDSTGISSWVPDFLQRFGSDLFPWLCQARQLISAQNLMSSLGRPLSVMRTLLCLIFSSLWQNSYCSSQVYWRDFFPPSWAKSGETWTCKVQSVFWEAGKNVFFYKNFQNYVLVLLLWKCTL